MAFEAMEERNGQELPLDHAGINGTRRPGFSEKLEKESALEKIRRRIREYPPLKAVILIVGSFTATGVAHIIEKVHEHKEIRDEITAVDKQLTTLQPLQERTDKLDSLFGNHSPFSLRYEKMSLDSDKQRLERENSDFSFFEGVKRRSVLDRWLDKLIFPQSEPSPVVQPSPEYNAPPILETSSLETSSATLTPKELRKYLVESYPKGWIENEVAAIRQVDIDERMPEEYGIEGQVAGSCAGGDWDRRANITLMRLTKDDNLHVLTNSTISHELGHANDWDSDQEMTEEERINLLLAVGERLDDSDRYQSWYVESIQNKDKKYELYKKAKEYWAEICRQYFYIPHDLNIKDFRLVEGVIKKADPQFDVSSANNERVRSAYRLVDRHAASMKPQRP